MVPMPFLNERQGARLHQVAWRAIHAELGLNEHFVEVESDERLDALGASFVTLICREELAGCVGSLRPVRPLLLDVASNANAAAFHDRRFAKITWEDLTHLRIEIAILSPLQELEVENEAQLLAQIEPFRHGLVLEAPGHQATFLPKVWHHIPRKVDFIAQLKSKAGLVETAWPEQMRCYLYTTENV